MGKKPIENQEKFTDLLTKSWFTDGQKIKYGDSPLEIMSGKSTVIDIKKILIGEKLKTLKIVIDKEDKVYLLKSNKELK